MRLSLLANAALTPILKSLQSLSPHETSLHILSEHPAQARRQLRDAAANAYNQDALLVLDGYDLLPESGWQNGEVPLVVPMVHNVMALLLGGDSQYRRLFSLYDGGICWLVPGGRREYAYTPLADCQALCALASTQLPLPESALTAQAIANYQNWDYLEQNCDFCLLESLLGGQWSHNAFVFAPGQTVSF